MALQVVNEPKHKAEASAFDLDETLLVARSVLEALTLRTLAQLGIHEIDGRPIKATDLAVMSGLSKEDNNKFVLETFGVNPEEFREIRTPAERDYFRYAPSGVFEGVPQVLNFLTGHQSPWAVVTNSDDFKLETYLLKRNAFEISDLDWVRKNVWPNSITNDRILEAKYFGRAKPHPYPYKKVAKNMRVKPRSLLVFEDSKTGLKSALAAGAQVAWLKMDGKDGVQDPKITDSVNFVVENYRDVLELIERQVVL